MLDKDKLKAYPELSQTSEMEIFEKILDDWKPLSIFTKVSTLDVFQGSECAFYSISFTVCL